MTEQFTLISDEEIKELLGRVTLSSPCSGKKLKGEDYDVWVCKKMMQAQLDSCEKQRMKELVKLKKRGRR